MRCAYALLANIGLVLKFGKMLHARPAAALNNLDAAGVL